MVQALRLLERVCDDVPGLLCSEFDANSVAAMKVLAKDIPGIEFPGQDQVAPADAHEWQDAGNQGSD